MICSRCNKRPAVVFITKMEGDKATNEGLCLTCAKELGIKPVEELINKMGLSEEDMDQVAEAISLVIKEKEDGIPKARAIVAGLTAKYPLN